MIKKRDDERYYPEWDDDRIREFKEIISARDTGMVSRKYVEDEFFGDSKSRLDEMRRIREEFIRERQASMAPYYYPKTGNQGFNPCEEIKIAPLPSTVTIARHAPIQAGTLAVINWALVGGIPGDLYEEEQERMQQGLQPGQVFFTTSISRRKSLHVFSGRETVIVLDDVGPNQSEARVSYGEKVGWVNAYLLLPNGLLEDGARRTDR